MVTECYLHDHDGLVRLAYEGLKHNREDDSVIDEEVVYDEPEEGDIVTTDHEHWYQDGKLVVTGDENDVREYMDDERFWPNVWFISDHGNAHLITLI
jgi:hypothetical protein